MRSAPNQNRKIVYGLLIVVLFGAMFPYTQYLNDRKRQSDLGEAAIGEIDTADFVLKLALLGGLRGWAANRLWSSAEELKREQDWDQLKTTVDLITKLQPHFLAVWTFQGWNLAYNVSVEWDAPEDKYDWIKKGIQFLQAGVAKNRRSPDLIWDTAWTYYNKLGFADEAIILRQLFHDDDEEEFKTYTEPETGNKVIKNDNFQLGYGWFSRAIALVDSGAHRIQEGTRDVILIDPSPQRKGRPDDIAFRSMPAHAQTRYAICLEKKSMINVPATFGEVAKTEWTSALREWVKFGTFTYMTFSEAMIDGKRQKEPVHLDDASNLLRFGRLSDNQKHWTNRWSDQMNYRYWKDRCAAEATPDGVRARQFFYEGTIAYKRADFARAVDKFKQGLDLWQELLKKHKDYRDDVFNKKDTGLIVKRYLRALKQLGQAEPKNLPFKDLRAAVDEDMTLDPFDANEMLPTRAGQEGGTGSKETPARE